MRSLTTGFAAAAILLGTSALTTPAFATGYGGQDHTCQGYSNCNTTTNNYDNDNTYNKGGTGVGYGGTGVGYGGKGGHGGDGGDGGDANAWNYNANVAKGGNVHNNNSNSNDSHNKAYGGSSYSKGGDAEANNNGNNNGNLKNVGNSYQHQDQDQRQHQSIKDSGNSYNENDNSNSNNASQSVNTYNERAPVNTAYAAGLSVGEDTCMGSSSFGAQAVSFGLSIGTTWQDDNCRRLKNSRQLVALGYHRASTALMCVDEDVKNAMIMAGTPCPNGEVAAVYVAPTREVQTMAPVADVYRAPVHKRKHRKVQPPK